MAQFLLRAFFVAIAGFLLIWFGLPVLHSVSPETTKILSAIVGLPNASASTNEMMMAMDDEGPTNHVSRDTAPLPEAHPVSEPVAEEAPASPQPPAPAPAKPAESVVGSAAEKIASMAASAVSAAKKAISPEEASKPSVVTNVTVVVVEEELPPDPRAAQNEEPPYPWGIVVTNSFSMAADGTAVGVIKGGTPVAYADDKMLPHGRVYAVYPLENGLWAQSPTYVYENDMVLFEGVRYSESNREQRDALIDFCTAYGTYEQTRNDLFERMRARHRNPHETEYRRIKAERDALQTDINKTMVLFRKTDTEISDRNLRANLRTKLEKLRGEQVTMNNRYEPVYRKWSEWEKQNPLSMDDVPNTPTLQNLKNQMKKLAPAVEEIVPGLSPNWLH